MLIQVAIKHTAAKAAVSTAASVDPDRDVSVAKIDSLFRPAIASNSQVGTTI
jgi:hypothetical protein